MKGTLDFCVDRLYEFKREAQGKHEPFLLFHDNRTAIDHP